MKDQRNIETLTPREREILLMIAEGDSLPEIAHRLHRSLKTVESHRLSLGRKLNASNRVELARIAIAEGLVSVPGQPDGSRADTASHTQQELDLLKQLNDSVYNTTGRNYLQRFCRAASQLPGVDIAAICTMDSTAGSGDNPLNRIVLASSRRGEDGEPMRYFAEKTPCKTILKSGACIIDEGVAKTYPDDPWLKQIGAEGYLGVQLTCEKGEGVGGVGLISQKPMKNMQTLRRIIEFFAPRLAGVLQTCIEIEALRGETERYTHAPDSTDPSVSEALTQITRQVRSLAGIDFLTGLIDAICDTFGTQYAGICTLDREDQSRNQMKTVFFRTVDGHEDPLSYKVAGSPCAHTLERGVTSVPSNAASEYPNDAYFNTHGIEAYVGVKLTSPSEKLEGVTWLLDARPLKDTKAIEGVLSYFAPRIGAELEQLERYEALLQEREALETRLDASSS